MSPPSSRSTFPETLAQTLADLLPRDYYEANKVALEAELKFKGPMSVHDLGLQDPPQNSVAKIVERGILLIREQNPDDTRLAKLNELRWKAILIWMQQQAYDIAQFGYTQKDRC